MLRAAVDPANYAGMVFWLRGLQAYLSEQGAPATEGRGEWLEGLRAYLGDLLTQVDRQLEDSPAGQCGRGHLRVVPSDHEVPPVEPPALQAP